MVNAQKNHIIESLKKNVRYDGRKNDEYRKVTVEYGVVNNAEGSARVKIGSTEVIAGIKLSIIKPYPDTPDEGCLAVGAELLPMSNPDFELGPPGIKAIEIARVVDRGIRESKTVDTKKMCIKKDEEVWSISIDICTINDDGNLLDASALASIAALKDTKYPKYEDGKIDYSERTKNELGVRKLPVEVTVIKIDGSFIVDPLLEEEEAIDARLTVATLEDGKICALQKGGEDTLSMEDIFKMIDIAIEKGKELREYLG